MADAVDAFRFAVIDALGYAPVSIEPGRLHRFATSGRRGDDAGWCKLFADLRGGVFGCHRQGISDTWCSINRAELTREQRADLARRVAVATAERKAAQRHAWAENAHRIALVWSQCVPLVPGDPVTLYLKRRGLGGVWPQPEALRLHRGLTYWDGDRRLGVFPAMVAPVMAPDGRVVALHRTYLTANGCKADVPSPKKLTGAAGVLAGTCIPLYGPVHGRLGIAEGIETALAASSASGVPTVAAYCAGNLAAWRWPASARHLVIFADADTAGREAAEALRSRATAANLRCSVMMPMTEGADWCDVWAQRGAVELRT